MFNSKSINAHITQHDWAQVNRAALLRSLHAGREPQVPVAASSGWGSNVSGNDPRSVRACLASKGDLRAKWWRVYSALYMAAVPGATLERAMYAFHRLHHALSLSKIAFVHSVVDTPDDVEQKGVLAAIRDLVVRETKC